MMSWPAPPLMMSLPTAAGSVLDEPPCSAAARSLAVLTICGWPTAPVMFVPSIRTVPVPVVLELSKNFR
ncbi:Uncharacterised protein [Achromobacter xylosoxidans]|nr:Uncharacterised protein [Achromobacter xylosoxidans]